MNPVLKKMLFKGQSPVLLLDAPEEFAKTAKDFGVPVDTKAKPKQAYPFILAFARSMADGERLGTAVAKSLADDGMLWLAYPKGTSKKYKKADINRDSGHAMMGTLGFDGVSLVALDDDWSAMRFKRM